MFLVERIIGIITYVLVNILCCYYIGFALKDKKKLKNVLMVYNILLFMLAYFYIPSTSADLYRHYNSLPLYNNYSWSGIIEKCKTSTIPVFNMYMFIISKIGLKGLLPGITSLIFYGCFFSIILKASNKFNLSLKNVAYSIFFFMCLGRFLEVISGIRCLLAFSIISFCIYLNIVENKKNMFLVPLYLVACFLHPAAIAFVLIRLVYSIIQPEKNLFKRLINYINIILIIALFYNKSNIFLDAMFSKAEEYLSVYVYVYIWEYIISYIFCFFSLYSLVKFKKLFKKYIIIEKYYYFVLFLNIVVLVLSFEYNIFNRFTTALAMLFSPLFEIILCESKNNMNKKYINIVYLTTMIIFAIACTRGNLSGYKFLLIT